jgi:hypothetical protein
MIDFNRVALQPRDIGLILSYRCQAECAHCLYNCGSQWHDWMAPEEVADALEQAKTAWGGGFQVHLTGGEPFLNFPLLLRATKEAVRLAIPVYVETNAGWVRDLAMAEDRFRRLREAGMGAVLVSVSPFHQESIPLQRTLDGISAARAVFGPKRVIVYQADWLPELARRGLTDPVPLSDYRAEYGTRQAGLQLWMGFGLISGGRAGYRLREWVPKRPAEAFKGERCGEELAYAQHSHLDLYGNFIPAFCGGISLGDWRDLPGLVRDVRRGRVPRLAAILMDEGPYGLYHLAVDEAGYQPPETGFTGKCHLCVDVRRHLLAAGLFEHDLTPAQFYQNLS